MSGVGPLSDPSSVLRVTRGLPTAAELAAVTAVLLAARQTPSPENTPNSFAGQAHWERAPLPGGPHAAHRPAGSWQAHRTR